VTTEAEFYQAVKAACTEAGIDDQGRSFVEMTCLDNADEPARIWEMALDTLKFFISTGDLGAASRNER
jgi:hypothetical protein